MSFTRVRDGLIGCLSFYFLVCHEPVPLGQLPNMGSKKLPFLLRDAASNPDGFGNSHYIKPAQNFYSYSLNFAI